jgi:hypothetical protein
MTAKELESELLSLTFAEKMEILQVLLRDFANIWTGVDLAARPTEGDPQATKTISSEASTPPTVEAFEELADQLADDLLIFTGASTPPLSEYAVSRAGIYEEHP